MTSRHTRYQAVILREDNALLLVRCVFSDGRDWWMLPGGGREEETEEECVAREVREETGLDVRVERLLHDQAADPPDGMYVRWRTFLCRIVGGEACVGGGEGPNATLVDVMWLPLFDECAWPAAIRHDQFLPAQLRAFRAALCPPIAAVLFDFDDTLLDRRATVERYIDRFVARVGFSPERAQAYRGRFHALDGAGYTPRATVFEQLAAEFPGSGMRDELVAEWRAGAFDECVYIDGATDVLAWCRRVGLKTAIVTNGRSALQRPKLERVGVIPLVDTVLVSGEEGIAKPDPELPRRAADRLGVAPEACAFVGDNPHTDISGAVAAGMHAIWLERFVPWPNDAPRPAHSIADIGALPKVISPRASP